MWAISSVEEHTTFNRVALGSTPRWPTINKRLKVLAAAGSPGPQDRKPQICSLSSTVLRGVLIRLYTKFNSSGEYQKSLNSWRLATLNNSVSGRKRIIRRNINTSTYALVAELAQAAGLGPVYWRFESSRGYHIDVVQLTTS